MTNLIEDKELHLKSICKITPANFETATTQDNYEYLCN